MLTPSGKKQSHRIASLVAAAAAFTTWEAGAATTMYPWAATPLAIETGTTALHYSMAVYDAGNLVDMVYTKSGSVYFRSATMPTGTVSGATLIAANADNASIATDSAGGLHVASYDTVNKDLLYSYSNNGGTSWTTTTLVSTEDRGQGTAITVDAANRVHIVYRGQNGTSDGLITGKGNPGTAFYDLWYTRFNADATAGGTTTPASWDAGKVIMHPSRASDGRNFIQVGSFVQNFDIAVDGTNVWVQRREGENSETASGGTLAYRALGAPAANNFSYSTSDYGGQGGAWSGAYMGQMALRKGMPYRVAWDRNQNLYAPGTLTGFVGVPYDSVGNMYDTNPGVANYQAYAIDNGIHASYYNVGQRMDLASDAIGELTTVYYNNVLSPNLRFGFSFEGSIWTTEGITGSTGYGTGDNRIGFDPLTYSATGLGQLYVLTSNGSGNLALFYRDAFFAPEPTSALLLMLAAGLAAPRRARRAGHAAG